MQSGTLTRFTLGPDVSEWRGFIVFVYGRSTTCARGLELDCGNARERGRAVFPWIRLDFPECLEMSAPPSTDCTYSARLQWAKAVSLRRLLVSGHAES